MNNVIRELILVSFQKEPSEELLAQLRARPHVVTVERMHPAYNWAGSNVHQYQYMVILQPAGDLPPHRINEFVAIWNLLADLKVYRLAPTGPQVGDYVEASYMFDLDDRRMGVCTSMTRDVLTVQDPYVATVCSLATAVVIPDDELDEQDLEYAQRVRAKIAHGSTINRGSLSPVVDGVQLDI
jgi:hypothetical protein